MALPLASRLACLNVSRKIQTPEILVCFRISRLIIYVSEFLRKYLRHRDREENMRPLLQNLDRTFFENRLTTLREQAIPPWRNMPSRDLAKLLGVSLQVLANWRIRGCGPAPAPHRRGNGNRTFYRRSTIMEWLSGMAGQPQPEWMHVRDWLIRFRLLDGEPTEAEVARVVAHLAQLPIP